MNDAYEAARQMDYLTAIIKLDDFLERYPNNPQAIEAQYHKGDIYVAQGRYDQAITEYQKVIDKYPVSNELNLAAKFAIADCYVAEKKVDKAEEIMNKINEDPQYKSNMKAKFAVANFYTTQKEWDKARDIWEKVAADTTQQYPGVMAKYNIAKSYEDQKQWAKSEKTFRETLAMLPIAPTKEVPKEPAKEVSEKLDVNITQDMAGVLYKAGKIQQAVALYESLKNKYPENEYAQGVGDWAQVKIADIYAETKQSKKAKEYYDKAIATYAKMTADPLLPDKAAWAMTKIAEIQDAHLHNPKEARAIYEDIVKNYSKTRWVRFAQGALMQMSQRTTAQDTTKSMMPPVSPDTTKQK